MRSVSGIRLFGFRLGILVLVIYWCAIFTGTHLPVVPSGVSRINDKLMHFTAFFFLATLLCYCTNSAHVSRRAGWIIVVCMGYAVIDESTQAFVRGRTPDVRDFLADTLGTLLAVGLYFAVRKCSGRRRGETCRNPSTATRQST